MLVITDSSVFHILNDRLEPVASTALTGVLRNRTPATASGYVYIPIDGGVAIVDLIALMQKRSGAAISICCGNVISPITATSERAYAIVETPEKILTIIGAGTGCSHVHLPSDFDSTRVFEPAIVNDSVLIATHNADRVWHATPSSGSVLAVDLGGRCVAAISGPNGLVCLIERHGQYSIVEARPRGVLTRIPLVENDVTWISHCRARDSFLWGNGATVTVQTERGNKLISDRGNISELTIRHTSAFALMQDQHSSFVIEIDLNTGVACAANRLGEYGFASLAALPDSVVVGNGAVLKITVTSL